MDPSASAKYRARPIHVVEATPYRVVVIDHDRIVDPSVLGDSTNGVDASLEREFRRVHSDHNQSLVFVLIGPLADVKVVRQLFRLNWQHLVPKRLRLRRPQRQQAHPPRSRNSSISCVCANATDWVHASQRRRTLRNTAGPRYACPCTLWDVCTQSEQGGNPCQSKNLS